MKITSTAFDHNKNIPSKYTCDGENVSPDLKISEVPNGTKSFALIVDDPDATGGLTFNHWIVWNILSELSEIKEGVVPKGAVEGVTSFGNIGYGGPCPGSGTHRYFFKMYALDVMLDLTKDSNKEKLQKAIEEHTIDYGELIGLYKRQ